MDAHRGAQRRNRGARRLRGAAPGPAPRGPHPGRRRVKPRRSSAAHAMLSVARPRRALATAVR